MIENFEHLHSIKYYTEVNKKYSYRGNNVTEHVAEIGHTGLGAFDIIKFEDKSLVDSVVQSCFSKWDEQWKKVLEQENVQTKQDNLSKLENLLNSAIVKDNSFDFETLYVDNFYAVENPKSKLQKELVLLVEPQSPQLLTLPIKPDKIQFEEPTSLFDNLIKSRKQKKIEFEDFLYNNAIVKWQQDTEKTENQNQALLKKYEDEMNLFQTAQRNLIEKYDTLERQWIAEKKDFFVKQDIENESVTELKNSYFNKEPYAVVKYCELVLNAADNIRSFPRSFEIEFKADEKFLVIDYALPCIEDLPKMASFKLNARKELKETVLSEIHQTKNYESALYKIVLKTIYELFQSDKVDAIELIAFNGWVNAINKGTGKRVNSCIMSVQVSKSEFNFIDLANVDPKICFKNLKGVSSSKLISLTAIKPIIQISRDDKRFVSSYDVTDSLDESSNLAIMSWEDFEHLIREIFQKEFSNNGGEVKVTQASRDGGVDAIAFDPDPIRGGKIVIQAKRYTNTVGVSAVRDLYGTVMNEGATKGILVTTTDFGPDAYEFVKNKPLTLMNGSNLLYLLERHGHKAKIDIEEARFLISKNNQL